MPITNVWNPAAAASWMALMVRRRICSSLQLGMPSVTRTMYLGSPDLTVSGSWRPR
jgi:hypothetical protein